MLKIRHSIGPASDVEYSTFDGQMIECQIFDIQRRPIWDRKLNRIFLHTSNPKGMFLTFQAHSLSKCDNDIFYVQKNYFRAKINIIVLKTFKESKISEH